MIKILVVVVLVAIIAISAVGIVDNNYSIDYGGYNPFSSSPFLTLTANITDKSPQANFTNGYASPSLWGFVQGGGNASMLFYRNSSIYEKSNLTGNYGMIDIFTYSSEHLSYGLPMSSVEIDKSNLSSYVSFDIKKISSGVANDLAYDMFLGQNNTSNREVEIMLLDNMGISNQLISTGRTVYIPIYVNGTLENITWNIDQSQSASGSFSNYVIIPSIPIFTTSSENFKLSISAFIEYLYGQHLLPFSDSLLKLGIGSEFTIVQSTQTSQYFFYSFWLYSYFVINGTDYQIVQSTNNIPAPLEPWTWEARP